MPSDAQLTPMMAQYRRIKGQLPADALLLVRLGDFYEMFFEDAQQGAQLLHVALTKRGLIPMCGIPYHAANTYIARLLKAGKKVAICDQMEDARPGQLVKREVTQILSPGTHLDERMLSAERNNFLAAIYPLHGTYGLAIVDLTTGDFQATQLESDAALLGELERLRPAEIILPSQAAALRSRLQSNFAVLNNYDDWAFAPETSQFTLRDHFKVSSLDGFGLKNRPAAIGAAGAVLHYLSQHLRREVTHLTRLSCYEGRDFLILDAISLRHLEILEPLHRDAPRAASLYGAVNRTITPMGARRLREWLAQPLAAMAPIIRRQEVVETWVQNSAGLERFRQQLAEVRDMERTLSRLSIGSGNARDLVVLRLALEQIPELRRILFEVLRFNDSVGAGRAGQDLIHEVPPSALREEFQADDPGQLEPTGHGACGPIFEQLRGKPRAAIAHLMKLQAGEVPGALFHPEVGEIDLVWGNAGHTPGRGYGLTKIVAYHPEVLSQLQELLLQMAPSDSNENTIQLDSATHRAIARTNWKGTAKRWLLTAIEKRDPSVAGRTMDIPSSLAEPGPAGMTQLPPPHGGLAQPIVPPPIPVKPPTGGVTGSVFRNEGMLPLLVELAGQLCDCPDLVDLISHAVVDDPPLALKEGGLIRDGFDAALDELRRATREGKDWIARLQQQEIERTGIPSLKVRFNSVFGYYIEVTKTHLDKVPADYVRKQTIAGGERFITPALKEMESKILGAEERSLKLEYELFLRVREGVIGRMAAIQQTAQALAQLDVLAGFAETARLFDYCRPTVAEDGVLQIREGRHPVLDQVLTEERFVPNDTELDLADQQIALITGPNMAGKSTYIRQVALLALLAHTGSFVPAKTARIDLLDRIFTRIGASDDLTRGQSTFMVEMSETANILNNATRNSLIILDEIGRGTSTFDGLSLAWAIVEHLHNQVGAKTLFATHYHELTELAGRLNRLRNFNVAVREWNDQIIFLRKIVPGGTDKSYGIQVARLAGVPKPVLSRAKEILSNLEESELTPEGKVRSFARHRAEREKLQKLAPPPQLDLFSPP
ncbi:MAG: DNA mismatch repair protein MutS [Verrucomicrobia bacterium]|nr:DNA mismatch repair protein MutS [Verrucomicrobiota bacterium]